MSSKKQDGKYNIQYLTMICIIIVSTIFLQILNAFRTPDDMPVKDVQLKGYNTGELLVVHVALGQAGTLSDLCNVCHSENV